MGRIIRPHKAKLIAGILLSSGQTWEHIARKVETEFGPIDSRSPVFPFTHTEYYNAELGSGIQRFWVSFEWLIEQDELADLKTKSNMIEELLARPDGTRTVNIDPGYIVSPRLVLASTKDHAHRIYIGEGIYAEVTLVYRNGSFQALPWTYPDYLEPRALEYFHKVREEYLKQTKE